MWQAMKRFNPYVLALVVYSLVWQPAFAQGGQTEVAPQELLGTSHTKKLLDEDTISQLFEDQEGSAIAGLHAHLMEDTEFWSSLTHITAYEFAGIATQALQDAWGYDSDQPRTYAEYWLDVLTPTSPKPAQFFATFCELLLDKLKEHRLSTPEELEMESGGAAFLYGALSEERTYFEERLKQTEEELKSHVYETNDALNHQDYLSFFDSPADRESLAAKNNFVKGALAERFELLRKKKVLQAELRKIAQAISLFEPFGRRYMEFDGELIHESLGTERLSQLLLGTLQSASALLGRATETCEECLPLVERAVALEPMIRIREAHEKARSELKEVSDELMAHVHRTNDALDREDSPSLYNPADSESLTAKNAFIKDALAERFELLRKKKALQAELTKYERKMSHEEAFAPGYTQFLEDDDGLYGQMPEAKHWLHLLLKPNEFHARLTHFERRRNNTPLTFEERKGLLKIRDQKVWRTLFHEYFGPKGGDLINEVMKKIGGYNPTPKEWLHTFEPAFNHLVAASLTTEEKEEHQLMKATIERFSAQNLDPGYVTMADTLADGIRVQQGLALLNSGIDEEELIDEEAGPSNQPSPQVEKSATGKPAILQGALSWLGKSVGSVAKGIGLSRLYQALSVRSAGSRAGYALFASALTLLASIRPVGAVTMSNIPAGCSESFQSPIPCNVCKEGDQMCCFNSLGIGGATGSGELKVFMPKPREVLGFPAGATLVFPAQWGECSFSSADTVREVNGAQVPTQAVTALCTNATALTSLNSLPCTPNDPSSTFGYVPAQYVEGQLNVAFNVTSAGSPSAAGDWQATVKHVATAPVPTGNWDISTSSDRVTRDPATGELTASIVPGKPPFKNVDPQTTLGDMFVVFRNVSSNVDVTINSGKVPSGEPIAMQLFQDREVAFNVKGATYSGEYQMCAKDPVSQTTVCSEWLEFSGDLPQPQQNTVIVDSAKPSTWDKARTPVLSSLGGGVVAGGLAFAGWLYKDYSSLRKWYQFENWVAKAAGLQILKRTEALEFFQLMKDVRLQLRQRNINVEHWLKPEVGLHDDLKDLAKALGAALKADLLANKGTVKGKCCSRMCLLGRKFRLVRSERLPSADTLVVTAFESLGNSLDKAIKLAPVNPGDIEMNLVGYGVATEN